MNTPHEITHIRFDGGAIPVSQITGRWKTKRSENYVHIHIEVEEYSKLKWIPENDISFIWEPIINECSR